jgi:hypothetical protein
MGSIIQVPWNRFSSLNGIHIDSEKWIPFFEKMWSEWNSLEPIPLELDGEHLYGFNVHFYKVQHDDSIGIKCAFGLRRRLFGGQGVSYVLVMIVVCESTSLFNSVIKLAMNYVDRSTLREDALDNDWLNHISHVVCLSSCVERQIFLNTCVLSLLPDEREYIRKKICSAKRCFQMYKIKTTDFLPEIEDALNTTEDSIDRISDQHDSSQGPPPKDYAHFPKNPITKCYGINVMYIKNYTRRADKDDPQPEPAITYPPSVIGSEKRKLMLPKKFLSSRLFVPTSNK